MKKALGLLLVTAIGFLSIIGGTPNASALETDSKTEESVISREKSYPTPAILESIGSTKIEYVTINGIENPLYFISQIKHRH